MVAGDPAAAGPGSASARTIVRSAATAVLIAWSLRLIGLVSVLVLARMLTPQDFGKATLATSVVALVDIFSALGLRQALLRIRAPERAHYDTAWTIQLLVLTVLAVVLMAIGPVAARFYEEPALAAIIAILACCFVIDGLGNIGTVDFERHMNFNRDLKMRVSVRLGSFAVTVTMAVILQNFWALVIGMVAQSALYAAASYIFHSYRPRFSLAKRKELLGVSLWMFLASASQTIHSQVEKLVVGRIATRGVLGLYSVSRDLSSIFTEEIATAFNRVTFVTTAQQVGPLSTDADRCAARLWACRDGRRSPADFAWFAVDGSGSLSRVHRAGLRALRCAQAGHLDLAGLRRRTRRRVPCDGRCEPDGRRHCNAGSCRVRAERGGARRIERRSGGACWRHGASRPPGRVRGAPTGSGGCPSVRRRRLHARGRAKFRNGGHGLLQCAGSQGPSRDRDVRWGCRCLVARPRPAKWSGKDAPAACQTGACEIADLPACLNAKTGRVP
jgi:hypothetical protein